MEKERKILEQQRDGGKREKGEEKRGRMYRGMGVVPRSQRMTCALLSLWWDGRGPQKCDPYKSNINKG